MSRKDNVETLLAYAEGQYQDIRERYDEALHNESLDLSVPVKNLMENLRSALDYMAHDIYESCCHAAQVASGKPEPRNIYFPYGHTEADFASGVGSSLPELSSLAPTVYDLIASIQPYRGGDTWLCDLCSILNENKHDQLTPQVRSETETYTVSSDYGRVTIPVNNPSVRIRSLPGAVKLFGVPAQFTDEGIHTAPSDRLKHQRTKWIAFVFKDFNVDVLRLLGKAVPGITGLADDLYRVI
ncbi:MAG: hypothetical protein V3R87_00260 [Dehalococcoidia bacterium]